MRILVTGGAGFVGSNVVKVGAERGEDVTYTVHSEPPPRALPCASITLDLLDAARVHEVVRVERPDVIVHTAILNDFRRIYAERRLAWDAYVGATRTLADAANTVGAKLVYVSTDWVFDGTQSGADEETPPNPINYYGVLKAASELVTLERARHPVVARIAGVMGTHWARLTTPRTQDPGFGYFVASIVTALEQGRPFTVWESDAINMVATPSLASESARMMLALAERGLGGIFHCCGGEATTRMALARATAEAFELDQSLLRSGPPDPAALPPAPIPRDTSIDGRATAAAIGNELPSVRELLRRFRAERETAAAPA